MSGETWRGSPLKVEWSSPPRHQEKPRSRKKAQGVRYEKRVRRILEDQSLMFGPWMRVQSGNKVFHRQPDAVLVGESEGLVAEIKHTEVQNAWDQLSEYAELLSKLYEMPFKRLLIAKIIHSEPDGRGPEDSDRMLALDGPDARLWHLFI